MEAFSYVHFFLTQESGKKLERGCRTFTIGARKPGTTNLRRRVSCFSCQVITRRRGYLVGVPFMTDLSSETNRLLRQAAQGDPEQFGAVLERCRPRLRRMLALRIDPRLHGRIDPSDVIQETYLEASARLAEYLQKPAMPFFLWLRFLAGQKLVTLHRHHLGTRMRDVGREVSLYRGRLP